MGKAHSLAYVGMPMFFWPAPALPKRYIIADVTPELAAEAAVRFGFEKSTGNWRDIINDPLQREEMVTRSGQQLSPCVDVNGHLLADVSGAEVEAYLVAHGLVQPSDRDVAVPTNAGCGG